MSLARALSKQICRVLSGVLLFAQCAVASYACPGLSGMQAMGLDVAMSTVVTESSAPATVSLASESTAMPPGCDQIDQNAANLQARWSAASRLCAI